ncbi:hypothetical protein NM2001068_2178 [Neisseria meningitidis 2001068]|nr:hypothetical protein NM2001068_2165 [Neisseria meningitidis 2001068]EOC41820.1 hypothetical protein NM2001068_2178 [Neisseria meningitidis 2001068]
MRLGQDLRRNTAFKRMRKKQHIRRNIRQSHIFRRHRHISRHTDNIFRQAQPRTAHLNRTHSRKTV